MIWLVLAAIVGVGVIVLGKQAQVETPLMGPGTPTQPPYTPPPTLPFAGPVFGGKKTLPSEVLPAVEWLTGLGIALQKAGVYQFDSLKGGWDAINQVAEGAFGTGARLLKGDYIGAVVGVVGAMATGLTNAEQRRGEYWMSYNIISAYCEEVGYPPTSVWVMLAAYGRSTGPTPPRASPETWAPPDGHLVALQILDVLKALDGYILPVVPRLWSPEHLMNAGLSVVNKGVRIKDPSAPIRIQGYLASADTALADLMPYEAMRLLVWATRKGPADHYRDQIRARKGVRDDWWYRMTPDDCYLFMRKIWSGGPTGSRLETAKNGNKYITPSQIGFKLEGPSGHIPFNVPERTKWNWLLWPTNPGGGWLATDYPYSKKW